MITYNKIDLPGGEELCYLTSGEIPPEDGLNIYDEEKKVWVIGIPWDREECEWEERHRDDIAAKPAIEREAVLRDTEEKYILKYKTVDKKIRPVPMATSEEMKVKRRFPADPLANLPALLTHAPEFTPTAQITIDRAGSSKIRELIT